MRADLAGAVGDVLAGMVTAVPDITTAETEALLKATDVVTLARTGVQYDCRGDVVDAHAPEMPTRFAKQLTQVMRGGVAIGMDRAAAMRLAIRCAPDSIPPLRPAIIDDLAVYPHSTTGEVRRRLGEPRATADRQLQALHILGLLDVFEQPTQVAGHAAAWRYIGRMQARVRFARGHMPVKPSRPTGLTSPGKARRRNGYPRPSVALVLVFSRLSCREIGLSSSFSPAATRPRPRMVENRTTRNVQIRVPSTCPEGEGWALGRVGGATQATTMI
jgi:hypothetical protein